MKSVNPYTGDLIGEYEEMTREEADEIVSSVGRSFHSWKRSPFSLRSTLMRRLATLLREQKSDLALMITSEMGKVVGESEAEIEKCAWVCSWYADHAEEYLRSEPVKTEFSESYVAFRPLGVILAVMPWNFPFWQVFRFAAPALMAGNAAVLKHASNVTGCALAIERLIREAGFPEDVFRTLVIGSSKVEAIIAHRDVQAVTLTGSSPAGRAVAQAAGKYLKKSLLELGGSDPYVIMADADLERAAAVCVSARLANAGQSCISAKRFIIVDPAYEVFREMVIRQMEQFSWGDPLDRKNNLGPLSRTDLRDELHRQVESSVEKGAVLVMGGVKPPGNGSFYPPTLLENVKPGMPAWHEELFGPVVVLFRATDEEEAIWIANDTSFGLGAAVFTGDASRGRKIAEERINAGCCFVNDFVRSDPRLPFGGIGESGYGRELSGFGIREFVNIKTVAVK